MAVDHRSQAHRHAVPGPITLIFFLGGAAATLIRLQPDDAQRRPGDADTYNQLFTAHGIIMVFFFLVPVGAGRAGQFPRAHDDRRPRPRLSQAQSAELVRLHHRRAFTLWAIVAGGVDTGWTFYTPFSTQSSHTNVIPTVVGIFISGFSSILTGLNFIVTIHRMRAPGLTWFRLPLFVWSIYATSIIMVLATPVLAMALVLVGVERALGHRHLRPGAGRRPAPVPAPVLVLLAPGGLHHDPAGHGRRQRDHPLLRAQEHLRLRLRRLRRASASPCSASSCGAHHMFVAGQSVYAAMIFSLLSYLVAVPSAIKVFNWTATLYKGSIVFRHADAVSPWASSACSPWAA